MTLAENVGGKLVTAELAAAFAALLATLDASRAKAVASLNDENHLGVLEALVDARVATDQARTLFVVHAKRSGATWQDIGEALRLPRQVVWRKYNHLI